MLHEEVAGVAAEPRASDEPVTADPPALTKARRRGQLAAALSLGAIAVLFLFRDAATPFLASAATEDTIFTLGVLAVAVHAGFRLGQLEKLVAVTRLCRELVARERGGGEDGGGAA